MRHYERSRNKEHDSIERTRPKNILILQGSPRANGNTAWMAEEYRKAAEAAGHKVTLVDVSHKKIAGCLACGYCRGKGNGACVQKYLSMADEFALSQA